MNWTGCCACWSWRVLIFWPPQSHTLMAFSQDIYSLKIKTLSSAKSNCPLSDLSLVAIMPWAKNRSFLRLIARDVLLDNPIEKVDIVGQCIPSNNTVLHDSTIQLKIGLALFWQQWSGKFLGMSFSTSGCGIIHYYTDLEKIIKAMFTLQLRPLLQVYVGRIYQL